MKLELNHSFATNHKLTCRFHFLMSPNHRTKAPRSKAAKRICRRILIPPCGENGQCAQKKYISLFPLLAQCRSGSAFFFFFPYTLSKRAYMEGRRKKASHSCTGPRVERGKCIFSGCIVSFLHKMVHYGSFFRLFKIFESLTYSFATRLYLTPRIHF